MSRDLEIISKGRCVKLLESELDDMRTIGCGWFAYAQQRLDKNHAETLVYFSQYPAYASRIAGLVSR